jgi:hypothetical protein
MKFMITFYHVDGAWDALTPGDQEEHSRWLADIAQALKDEQQTEMVFFMPGVARHVSQDASGKKSSHRGALNPVGQQAGGYFIVDVGSVEEAVEWADRTRFMVGSNEIQQIVDFKPG